MTSPRSCRELRQALLAGRKVALRGARRSGSRPHPVARRSHNSHCSRPCPEVRVFGHTACADIALRSRAGPAEQTAAGLRAGRPSSPSQATLCAPPGVPLRTDASSPQHGERREQTTMADKRCMRSRIDRHWRAVHGRLALSTLADSSSVNFDAPVAARQIVPEGCASDQAHTTGSRLCPERGSLSRLAGEIRKKY